MVRDTLGDDAVIVATREEQGGKAVRITAAVEQHDDWREDYRDDGINAGASPEEGDWADGRLEEQEDEEAILEKLMDVMIRHNVPEDVTDQVISCATVVGATDPGTALEMAFEHLFSFKPLSKSNASACMLVGSPGAGKTLATAKLAARSVMNGQSVSVVTTDTVRAGGVEQLAAFTNLLRVDLQQAEEPGELAACIDKALASGVDQVFIDTGGMNPFDPQEMKTLAKFAAVGSIQPVLVLPAGVDATECSEIARVYGTLGVRSLMPTRIDISRRLGGLLAAAHYGSLFFAEGSQTPKVADGLFDLTPRVLAKLFMPEAFKDVQRGGFEAGLKRMSRDDVSTVAGTRQRQKVRAE